MNLRCSLCGAALNDFKGAPDGRSRGKRVLHRLGNSLENVPLSQATRLPVGEPVEGGDGALCALRVTSPEASL
jgi:hypothetical protein